MGPLRIIKDLFNLDSYVSGTEERTKWQEEKLRKHRRDEAREETKKGGPEEGTQLAPRAQNIHWKFPLLHYHFFRATQFFPSAHKCAVHHLFFKKPTRAYMIAKSSSQWAAWNTYSLRHYMKARELGATFLVGYDSRALTSNGAWSSAAWLLAGFSLTACWLAHLSLGRPIPGATLDTVYCFSQNEA